MSILRSGERLRMVRLNREVVEDRFLRLRDEDFLDEVREDFFLAMMDNRKFVRIIARQGWKAETHSGW